MNTNNNSQLELYLNSIIGIDDTFCFNCTQCGKCCIHREDILLSPKDLFYISKKLQLSPSQVIAQYCENYIGSNSRFPIVRLKPRGTIRRCPMLKDNKCIIHDAKPAVCAMFPIGRYISKDAKQPDWETTPEIQYVYIDPECGDNAKTHTVREWLASFEISSNDDFFISWTTAELDISSILQQLEEKLSSYGMLLIWSTIFTHLYLQYNTNEDFMTQFQNNLDQIMPFIQKLHQTIIAKIIAK